MQYELIINESSYRLHKLPMQSNTDWHVTQGSHAPVCTPVGCLENMWVINFLRILATIANVSDDGWFALVEWENVWAKVWVGC